MLRYYATLVAGAGLAFAMPVPVGAEETADTATMNAAANNELVCLTASTRGKSAQHAFTIVVHSQYAESLAAKGFAATPCNGKGSSAAEFRQHMCQMASSMPARAQDGFAKAYGVSPAELCAMASAE